MFASFAVYLDECTRYHKISPEFKDSVLRDLRSMSESTVDDPCVAAVEDMYQIRKVASQRGSKGREELFKQMSHFARKALWLDQAEV